MRLDCIQPGDLGLNFEGSSTHLKPDYKVLCCLLTPQGLQLNRQAVWVLPELLQGGLSTARLLQVAAPGLHWPVTNEVTDAGLCMG